MHRARLRSKVCRPLQDQFCSTTLTDEPEAASTTATCPYWVPDPPLINHPSVVAKINLDTDISGDSNLDLIVAIIALSTAVFVGHLEYLAADDVTPPTFLCSVVNL